MKIDRASIEATAPPRKADTTSHEEDVRAETNSPAPDITRATLAELIGQEIRPALQTGAAEGRVEDKIARDIQKWINQRDFAVAGAPLARAAQAKIEAANLPTDAAKRKVAPMRAEMEPDERIELLTLRRIVERFLGKQVRPHSEHVDTDPAPDGENAPDAEDTDTLNVEL
ncbi:MAG: hypothetical protein ACLFV7_01395 [Phycisphaerae bacterium]